MIEPAHFWVPERVGSFGDEAIDLAAEAGRILDDEQKLGVDALLSYGRGGRWIALESAIIEARQNGKTAGVLLPPTLFDLFLLPPDRIVWTAHLFRTARDAFDDFCACIEWSPTLSRRVKKITYGHGEECIELHNGATLEFLARSSGGGRGLGGKRVIFDEALVLPSNAVGALLPTLSARPDPQVNYGSSAGTARSEYLARLVRRGRKGGDPSLIWIEYCAPGSWKNPPCDKGKECTHMVGMPGCALDNEDFWQLANHTLDRRITRDYVRAERRALPIREFGRERMGWHEEVVSVEEPIPEKQWLDQIDIESEAGDPIVVSFEVANDRSTSAIAMAGRRSDGKVHVELIKSETGVGWVVDDLVTLRDKWSPCVFMLDDRSEAASLLPELRKRGFKVRPRDPDPKRKPKRDELIVTTWASDLARACGQFYDAVTDQDPTKRILRHLNQPELNESVKGAAWRPLGNTRAWSRTDATTDPCPLIAATLAFGGLMTYGPKPTRGRAGFAFA